MGEENSAIKNLTAEIERKLCINKREPDIEETETELRIGCVNVGQLLAKGGKRKSSVEEIIEQRKFHIFIFQETWLYGTENLTVPSGFYYVRNERKFAKLNQSDKSFVKRNSTSGGGQLIYVKRGIKWEIKSEGEFGNTNVQYLHIEITQPVKLHLIAVYSPHKDHYKLVYTLMSWYIAALPAGAHVMFIGDVNIKWFTRTPFQYAFSDTLADRGIHQLIRSATFPSSGNCLDHIYTNALIRKSGVVNGENYNNFGDHHLIFCTISRSGECKTVGANKSVSGKEKKIEESRVYMLCKLEKYFDSHRKLAENEVQGGYLVLLARPTGTKKVDWVNEVNETHIIQWCNVFYATSDMVARLQKQLPVVDFQLYRS